MSQPEREELYLLHEEVKTKTFEQIIQEHYIKEYLNCTWLKRDYQAIRYHNLTDKDKHNPNFMLPCVNSMSDLFDGASTQNKPHHKFISYHTHCSQPELSKAIWVSPSEMTIDAFERQIGPLYSYREANGFDWAGLTQFSLVEPEEEKGVTYVYAHSGGPTHCLARVIDAKKFLDKAIGG